MDKWSGKHVGSFRVWVTILFSEQLETVRKVLCEEFDYNDLIYVIAVGYQEETS